MPTALAVVATLGGTVLLLVPGLFPASGFGYRVFCVAAGVTLILHPIVRLRAVQADENG